MVRDPRVDLASGNGYVTLSGLPVVIRGPLFPGLLAGSFTLFGVSASSAFLVVRAFVLANVLLTFALGTELFDRRARLFASLLVAFSYTINFWSFRHLDHVIAFFMLALVYAFLSALTTGSRWHLFAAGVVLGFGLLTKELALLFVPLPIVYVLFDRYLWDREHALTDAVWTLFGTTVVYAPWVTYVRFVTGDGAAALGKDQSLIFSGLFADGPVGVAWVGATIVHLVSGLVGFFRTFVLPEFFWTPLLLAGVGFVAYRAYTGDWRLRVFGIALLGLTPFVVVMGNLPYRLGQAIVVYLALYVCLGGLVSAAVPRLAARLEEPVAGIESIPLTRAAVIALLIVPQVFVGGLGTTTVSGGTVEGSDLHYLKNSVVAHAATGQSDTFAGAFEETETAATADWIEANTDRDETVLGSHTTATRKLYFLTRGERSIRYTPVVYASLNWQIYRPSQGLSESAPKSVDPNDIVYIEARETEPASSATVRLVRQRDILRQVRQHNVDHVVVDSTHMRALNAYYREHSAFERTATIEETAVYAVADPDPEPIKEFDPVVTDQFRTLAANTRTSDTAVGEEYRERIFEDYLGLPGAELDRLNGTDDGFRALEPE